MIIVVQSPSGAVTKESIGLGSVENIAPPDLPISDATQEALDELEDSKLTDAPEDGKYYLRKDGQWVLMGTAGEANVYTEDVTPSQSTVDFTIPSTVTVIAPLGIEKPSAGSDDIGILSVIRVNSTTARAYLTADATASGFKASIIAY